MKILLSSLPAESMGITEAVKKYGIEYLRHKPIVTGGGLYVFSEKDLDDHIAAWADEPHNQHLACAWVSKSWRLATAADLRIRVRLRGQEDFWSEDDVEATYSVAAANIAILEFVADVKEHGLDYNIADVEVSINGADCVSADEVFSFQSLRLAA